MTLEPKFCHLWNGYSWGLKPRALAQPFVFCMAHPGLSTGKSHASHCKISSEKWSLGQAWGSAGLMSLLFSLPALAWAETFLTLSPLLVGLRWRQGRGRSLVVGVSRLAASLPVVIWASQHPWNDRAEVAASVCKERETRAQPGEDGCPRLQAGRQPDPGRSQAPGLSLSLCPGGREQSRAWCWRPATPAQSSVMGRCRAGRWERQCPSLSGEVHFQGKMPFQQTAESLSWALSPKYKFSLLGGTQASPFSSPSLSVIICKMAPMLRRSLFLPGARREWDCRGSCEAGGAASWSREMDNGAVQRGRARARVRVRVRLGFRRFRLWLCRPAPAPRCHCASLLLSRHYVTQGVRCISESLPAMLTFSLKTSVKV